MFHPGEIKEEPLDEDVSKKKNSKKNSEVRSGTLKCTCKKRCSGQAEPLVDNKQKRQILVNFGLTRKKVFTLFSKDDKLHKIFTSYVLSEPAFSKLLKDSYVVFQEFNERFGTWVDIDRDDFIEDGTVLKAVFFPISIERDDSNPGSIKRKETEQTESKKDNNINVIDVSSSEESGSSSDDDSNSSKRKHSSLESEKHEIVEKSKKRKSDNVQKTLKQPSDKEMTSEKEDGGKSKTAIESTTEMSGTESNKNQANSFNSTSQQTPLKGNEADAPTPAQQESFSSHNPFKYSSNKKSPKYNNYKSYNHQKSQGNLNYQNRGTYYCKKTYKSSETYLNNGQHAEAHYEMGSSQSDTLQPVQKICQERKWPAPEVTAERHPHGWTCKVWVKGMFYMARHLNLEHAKRKAVQKAVNELTSANSNFFHSNGYRPT